MKISIITITYNSEATLVNTLNSVLSQSYKNIEHIIIDGMSKDKTLEICSNFPHISKIISEPDSGVYNAFNKGLRLANGDIIGFLNSDDIFYNEYSVEEIVNVFLENEVDIVYGNLDYINENGKIIRNWISKPFKKGFSKKAWMPAHPTFYCKKNIYNLYGGYDESFKIGGDFELSLRFLEVHNASSYFLNKKLVKMLIGGISNKGLISKWIIYKEELRALRKNKILVNPISFLFYKLIKIKQFIS